jgi:2-oxoglutarate/2-oxoacid ferredoxin oxidoreductase subunit beta
MFDYEEYLRMERLPHIWCPGCGNGIIGKALMRAIKKLDLEQDQVCLVSGIGCSSRLPGYLDFNTLHTRPAARFRQRPETRPARPSRDRHHRRR